MNTNKTGYQYKYNGKEMQDELDLNWYDYQARNYDPALGRWFNIDPASEVSRRYSPYAYALDNPVFFIDPDGMVAEKFDNDWEPIGKGQWKATRPDDSAATLATDANISPEQANEIVESQLGENYKGADGEMKSNVDPGDVVSIPEQVESYEAEQAEIQAKEVAKQEKVAELTLEQDFNEKKIDSADKSDYQNKVTVEAYSPENNIKTIGDGEVDSKARGLGGQWARKRAEKRLKKSQEFQNKLKMRNNELQRT